MSETASPRPSTVFDQPQADLVPDNKGLRLYGNIPNRVEVSLVGQDTFYVAIAVPTMLFTLMRDVLHVDPEIVVRLAIDQVGGMFVFSLMVGDASLYDLWYYTHTTIPKWLYNRSYHV